MSTNIGVIDRQRFEGKVVVVTGAAQGIGRGVALAAAREGAQLVLADRASVLEEVGAEAQALGALVTLANVDLETYAGATALMETALREFGRIDVLVNNVGGTIWAKPYQEYQEDEIEREVRRSLFPTLWCCRAVLPAMVKQGRGERLKDKDHPELFSGLIWSGEQAKELGLVDGLGSASYVAREIVGERELVDFTVQESPFDRFSKRIGASVAERLALYMGFQGPSLR